MRVAIIHYWLVSMRGGEKVLESLCRLFPDADIFTHVLDRGRLSHEILKHNIRTTFISKLPFATRFYQKYLPLMPLALEQLDLRNYDLVISTESGPAKGVLTSAGTAHICYCHSPMRYLWDFYQDYLEQSGFFTRQFFRLFAHRLRIWDLASAYRVDHFIANSNNVAKRIKRHYQRESTVIHPPVDFDAFTPPGSNFKVPEPDASYLFIGQLVKYKAADLAVRAFTASGRKLLIIGEGDQRKYLEKEAGPNISFAGRLDGDGLRKELWSAKALIFPGEEDFGIVPLEAMAAGKPVIAYARGGALETVKENLSGVFFQEQTINSLNSAIDDFETRSSEFIAEKIHASVAGFSREKFEERLRNYIDDVIQTGGKPGDLCDKAHRLVDPCS